MDWTALFHLFGLDVSKCGFAGQYDSKSRQAVTVLTCVPAGVDGYWESGSGLIFGCDSSHVQCRTFLCRF